MKTEPWPISVLMPVYAGDNEQHLQVAIDSLLSQSYPAAEILIIADGPLTPALDAVIVASQERSTALIRLSLSVNRGMSAALNAGIKAARHEWLARMDADDICHPQRLERQVSYLQEHPHTVLLGSWIAEFDTNPDEPYALRKLPAAHADIARYARWRCPFNHMTVMYRKSTLLRLGGYHNFGMVGDDYELWARFLMAGEQVANLPEVLVKARASGDFFAKRRRGLTYFKHEVREINALYRLGLLHAGHYVFHFVLKAVVRLAPQPLVRLIYRGIRLSS